MQNKLLINFSKKFWFWFWKKLMNGFAPSDAQGNYKRPKGIKVNNDYDINNQNGTIYLLVGNSCPWCQRALLVYQIRKLFKKINVIFLKADLEHGEWVFNGKFKQKLVRPFSEVTSIEPSNVLIEFDTIDNPRPFPSCFLVINGSNIVSKSDSGIPIP